MIQAQFSSCLIGSSWILLAGSYVFFNFSCWCVQYCGLEFPPSSNSLPGEPTWSPFFTCPSSDPFPSQNFSSSATLISPWVSSGYLSLHMTARRPEPPPSPPLPQTPHLGWWHHYFTSSSCPKPWSLPSIGLLFPSASVLSTSMSYQLCLQTFSQIPLLFISSIPNAITCC